MEPAICNYNGLEYNPSDPRFENLSKRAIKKLLKHDLWEATKDEKRLALREKTKLKRSEKRSEKRQKIEQGLIEPTPTKKKLAFLSELTNIGLIMDCAFNDLMEEKELYSLINQIGYAYGKNKIAPKSMKFCLSSVDASLTAPLNEKLPSWSSWKNVTVLPNSYLDNFDHNDLVYLSADSDNVIQELEQGKHYIIGAIVDKNRYKSLCQNKAMGQGIQTARLPIGEYIQMSTRKVLTVNQVCEIMLKWLEYKDWKKAFLEVIPGRKLVIPALGEEA
ncbi:guanine-1-methyltransferase-domain-containing protein [Mucor mucedo]|uniref:guanine-1-methyltransferase-domain-containing protein n=1 Tax=Mucor mucedo TaxID=29922 RepID=UPI0022204756|nr:guanine-1-methyltransferase-domain-containing protein [Mucor mucedo]KAI7886401.1 guanine-1-methyltransferase-domain-containing protein [Mucor mucedo]